MNCVQAANGAGDRGVGTVTRIAGKKGVERIPETGQENDEKQAFC